MRGQRGGGSPTVCQDPAERRQLQQRLCSPEASRHQPGVTPDAGGAFKEHFVNKCTWEMAGDKCSERRTPGPGSAPTAIRPSRSSGGGVPARRAPVPH